jgi:hypothetical protein
MKRLLIALLLIPITVAAQNKPLGIGRAATSEEIARLDIDVRPDGKGLPDGGREDLRREVRVMPRQERRRRELRSSRGY